MKKQSILVLMFSIWAVALVSAVALAFKLNRAPARAVVAEPPARTVETEATAVPPPPVADPVVIEMPPDRIVGHVQSHITPRVVRCSDWSDLTQGPAGQKVRICE